MKRILSLLTLFLVVIFCCNGQVRQKNKELIVYEDYEIMPSYPGGEQEMMKFIENNLKYPNTEADIQGRVIVRFLVTENGILDSIHITRGLDPDFDKEALRVVKAMPKWNPGRQKEKNIAVWYTLPIIFRIENFDSSEIPVEPIYTV